jgi:hypothetical protein
MKRNDHVTAAIDKFGTGKPGFSEGDPEAQVPATVVTADFLDAVQEELARAVEAYVPLDPADPGQLAKCLSELLPGGLYQHADFLSKTYDWKGYHALAGGHVKNHLGVLGEILYCDATGAVVPKQVTVTLPLTSFRQAGASPEGTGQWVMEYGHGDAINGMRNYVYWTTENNSLALIGEFHVPYGARLRTLHFGAFVSAGATLYASAGVHDVQSRMNGSNPLVSNQLGEQNWYPETTIALGDLLVESSHELAHVYFRPASLGPLTEIHYCRLTYLDPGPRNF